MVLIFHDQLVQFGITVLLGDTAGDSGLNPLPYLVIAIRSSHRGAIYPQEYLIELLLYIYFQIVALTLSDVIGDSLDTIASGPTTPSTTSHNDIIALLEKYNLTQVLPSSMQHILSQHKHIFSGGTLCVPIENGSYKHVQNIIVGSNSIATIYCSCRKGLFYGVGEVYTCNHRL